MRSGVYSYSGIWIVNNPYSISRIDAHDPAVMSPFSRWFKELLGEKSGAAFARETGTSQPAVQRAASGGDIAIRHLDKWADGFGLRGADRDRFIALGRAEKSKKYKRSGHLSVDLEARAIRAEDALLGFYRVAEQQGLPVPKSVRQAVEAIREMRGV